MIPWQLASKTEHSHQVALLAWAHCAARHGYAVADDPRGYALATRPALIDELIQLPVSLSPVPELIRLFAIHNQGHGDAVRGNKARNEGVKPGVLDLMLPVTQVELHIDSTVDVIRSGLFIELKHPGRKPKRATSKGATSAEQDDWIEYLTGQGYTCVVAYGWQEAADAIKAYMAGQ